MNTLTIGSTYRITFPQGSTKNMTLLNIYDVTENYQIKCTFLDNNNTKIHFTQGMIKNNRLNILKLFTDYNFTLPPVRIRNGRSSVSSHIEKYYELKPEEIDKYSTSTSS